MTTKKSEILEDMPNSANANITEDNPQEFQESDKKHGFLLIKNKSAEYIKEDKENNPNFLNKKSKKKDKVRASF